MNTTRQPRIAVADLPTLEQLTPEEMARILGAGRRFQPTVEALEDRQVPSATPTSIASALTHSQENYANTVNQAYQQYLGRAPDSAGEAYWISGLQHGMTDEQMEAGFIGSPEYIADHGGSGAGWVRGMYQNLLSRTPSNDEVNYWLNQLNQGVSDTSVAHGFAASGEREGDLVATDYQKYLGRTPSRTEIAYWVNTFENGQTNENVVAGFVGSTEYFKQAGGYTNAAAWLENAYHDILGRAASNQECLSWVGTEAGPVNGILMPPPATAGVPFYQVPVFHFSDANPTATPVNLVAIVQTGDGTWLNSIGSPKNVQVVANPKGGFDVLLSYTYANGLTDTAFAVIVKDGGGKTLAASTAVFTVNSSPGAGNPQNPTTTNNATNTTTYNNTTTDDTNTTTTDNTDTTTTDDSAQQEADAEAAALQAALQAQQEADAAVAAQQAAWQAQQDAAAQAAAQQAAWQAQQDADAQAAAQQAAQQAQQAADAQAAAQQAAQQAQQDADAQAAQQAAQQAQQEADAEAAAQQAAQQAQQEADAEAAAQQAAQQAQQDADAQAAAQQAAQQAQQDADAQAAAQQAAQQAQQDADAEAAAQQAAYQQEWDS